MEGIKKKAMTELVGLAAMFSQFGDHPTWRSKRKPRQKSEWLDQYLLQCAYAKRKKKKAKRAGGYKKSKRAGVGF